MTVLYSLTITVYLVPTDSMRFKRGDILGIASSPLPHVSLESLDVHDSSNDVDMVTSRTVRRQPLPPPLKALLPTLLMSL